MSYVLFKNIKDYNKLKEENEQLKTKKGGF